MTYRCILDCDGVLADFVGGLCAAAGIRDSDVFSPDRQYPLPYDLDGLIGHQIEDRLPEICNHEFWATLPLFPWARPLVCALSVAFDGNVFLCTSPGYFGNGFAARAVPGKEEWVCRNFPEFADRYVMTPSKHLLAHSGAILIDDSPAMCADFAAAGGHSVIFPQFWNAGYRIRRESSVTGIIDHVLQRIFKITTGRGQQTGSTPVACLQSGRRLG